MYCFTEILKCYDRSRNQWNFIKWLIILSVKVVKITQRFVSIVTQLTKKLKTFLALIRKKAFERIFLIGAVHILHRQARGRGYAKPLWYYISLCSKLDYGGGLKTLIILYRYVVYERPLRWVPQFISFSKTTFLEINHKRPFYHWHSAVARSMLKY